jgi:hypothetical protein
MRQVEAMAVEALVQRVAAASRVSAMDGSALLAPEGPGRVALWINRSRLSVPAIVRAVGGHTTDIGAAA